MSASEAVRIDIWPQSVAEFIALRDQLATTPAGGAAAMVLALLVFSTNPEAGRECLAATVDAARLEPGSGGSTGRQLRRANLRRIAEQIGAQDYLPRAYIRGATPENGYQLPELPYIVEISANPYSGNAASGTIKLFVQCSGADSARPITLKRDAQGLWAASEWSSLVMGIKSPTS